MIKLICIVAFALLSGVVSIYVGTTFGTTLQAVLILPLGLAFGIAGSWVGDKLSE